MTHFYFISYKLQHRYVLDSVKLMTRKNKYWYHFWFIFLESSIILSDDYSKNTYYF